MLLSSESIQLKHRDQCRDDMISHNGCVYHSNVRKDIVQEEYLLILGYSFLFPHKNSCGYSLEVTW